MVVTNTLTGIPGARDSSTPPTAAVSAKRTDNATAFIGDAVTYAAAAPGVITSEMISSAPTICTPCAAVRPIRTANNTDMARTLMPDAAARTGSAEANNSGRQNSATTAITNAATPASSHTDALDRPTIWPVNSENAVVVRPGYRWMNSTDRPMPKLSTTPTMVSCPPRMPSSASTTAASTDPTIAPPPTLNPVSRAADAPISANSDVPCTVKLMRRITTSGVITPDTNPSNAAAMIADCTNPTCSSVSVSARKPFNQSIRRSPACRPPWRR